VSDRRSPKGSPALVAFGRRLASLRAERGLTQEQLAHEAGLHRTVVGYIERGQRDVGISTVWLLAEALGVAPSEMLPSEPTSGRRTKG
jgi:transcriptional regulator with XRE-family HTH domain